MDLIFVHGLGGGSRKTWSKTTDPYHYWPKEWLPSDPAFQNVRIYSFGYVADWSEMKNSVLEINDFAHSLLGEIMDSPEMRKDEVSNDESCNRKTVLTVPSRLGWSWWVIVWVDWSLRRSSSPTKYE